MTPQLFINYKLKSVQHLPWKRFVYRALNTFVDDLFSFIIRMPAMHRASCFRDDIVFFVYLYQRWVYPTDKSRQFDEDAGDETSSAEEGKAKRGALGDKVSGSGGEIELSALGDKVSDMGEKGEENEDDKEKSNGAARHRMKTGNIIKTPKKE